MIINSTAQCVPLTPTVLRPGNVVSVVVHRISLAHYGPDPIPDNVLDGYELTERFKDRDLGTGGRCPYHILVRQDGFIEQMLPLLIAGSHATDHNWCTWAVAVAGNFDEREMTDTAWMRLVNVVSALAVLPRKVRGHTELPGASSDPSKRCPGKFVNMDYLRSVIDSRLKTSLEIREALQMICDSGFTL